MLLYDGIYAAAMATTDAYNANEDDLPQHMVDKIEPYTQEDDSWVDLICNFVESVFANKGDGAVSNSAEASEGSGNLLAVGAGVAATIAANGFWDSLGGRAAGICKALRRESGEEAEAGFPWPDPEDDPEPNDLYLPPEPAAE